jgi:O-antigen/teichoic acid export membrane protein
MPLKPTHLTTAATTVLFGNLLNLALGLLTSFPVARGLGPEGKGEFAFYSWATTLVVTLLAGGWQNAVATVASERPRDAIAAVSAGRRRLVLPVAALATASLGLLVGGSPGWAFAAAAAAAQVWDLPASGALVGSGRLLAYQAGLLCQNALMLVAALSLWQTPGALTPATAAGALALSMGASLTVHSWRAGTGLGWGARPASGSTSPTAMLARNAWLANFATFLHYRLDVLLVRHFSGVEALGFYSTATTIAELGRMAPNAVAQAALRPLGSAGSEGRGRVAREAVRLGLVSVALTLVPLSLAAPYVVPLLYGTAFSPVAPLIAWLSPGIAALSVASVGAAWLNVSGRSLSTARYSWLGAAVAAVAALVLIPAWGVLGAAVASSLSYSLMAAVIWRSARRG